MSRALYYLRHRKTPKVFPVTIERRQYQKVNFCSLWSKDDSSALFNAAPGSLHLGQGNGLGSDAGGGLGGQGVADGIFRLGKGFDDGAEADRRPRASMTAASMD
jgi:hypothetical protein